MFDANQKSSLGQFGPYRWFYMINAGHYSSFTTVNVTKIYPALVANGFNWSFKLVNQLSLSIQPIIVASLRTKESLFGLVCL